MYSNCDDNKNKNYESIDCDDSFTADASIIFFSELVAQNTRNMIRGSPVSWKKKADVLRGCVFVVELIVVAILSPTS